MFTINPKNVYDVIKPLVYSNCLFGMGILRLPNQSKTIYNLMKIHMVFSTFFNWIAIYITLSSIGEIMDFATASPMALMMYKTLVSVNSFITVIAPVLLWFSRKVLRDCLRQMLLLDGTFQNVLGVRNEHREQYIRLTWQIIATFSAMILVAICDTVFSLEIVLDTDILSVFMFGSVAHTFHTPILIMLVLDLNFCFFVRYLGKKIRDMNKILLGLSDKTPTTRPSERLFTISRRVWKSPSENKKENVDSEDPPDRRYLLREIRKGHSELCNLSRKINLVFGIQNLLSMGISFVMITGLLYTICSAFSWRDFTVRKLKEIIPSAIWTAIYAYKIWIVNHTSWSVSSEADQTGQVLYELLNSKVDEELQKEIQEFGVQMLQNPISFNACGFFTLDYTFVQGAIGSITTYLVILIQMSNAYEISTISDLTQVWNSSESSYSNS